MRRNIKEATNEASNQHPMIIVNIVIAYPRGRSGMADLHSHWTSRPFRNRRSQCDHLKGVEPQFTMDCGRMQLAASD
jgi:hypothetical protein